jgi:hypothetical protein
MYSRIIDLEQAAFLLDCEPHTVESLVNEGELIPAQTGKSGSKFKIRDIIIFKLAQVIKNIGVDQDKAMRYAEAVLGARLETHHKNIPEWIENETQELFCYIADEQLSRIFLRNKDDKKEMDVGAVRPVLLPVTRCEINVFRAIRPVVMRAVRIINDPERSPSGR